MTVTLRWVKAQGPGRELAEVACVKEEGEPPLLNAAEENLGEPSETEAAEENLGENSPTEAVDATLGERSPTEAVDATLDEPSQQEPGDVKQREFRRSNWSVLVHPCQS